VTVTSSADAPTTYRVAVLPGDGIGREVVPPTLSLLEAAAGLESVRFAWETFDWSCDRWLETGRMMPEDALDTLADFDAILLGAVGAPGVPDHVSLWGMLIPIRRRFHQYVNLRPMRLLPGVPSPLRDDRVAGLDLVVVRENNEGEYSQVGGRLYEGRPEEVAVQEALFTRTGVERVMTYAFELARTRRGHVTSATKSNGIVHTMPFWDEIFAETAERYPDVTTDQRHIDALAAMCVLRPTELDVIVASNLFGDILSDLTAAVAGGIGIAASGNLNPGREHPSMFEPVHGSAPDIAGQGIADPVGQIWSGVLMLDHLGHRRAADALLAATEAVLAEGTTLTPDLGGEATTDAVAEAIGRSLATTPAGAW
jgi:tartrate dehydrogenase/decarboxylase / D-malate dehydrogenase